MSDEPRYSDGVLGDVWTCLDCGGLIADKAAHTRFHSILGAHAWALAVLKNRAPAEVRERIDSKKFDSWSADALAEVIADHERT